MAARSFDTAEPASCRAVLAAAADGAAGPVLAWTAPDDARELGVLDAWCATTGPPAVTMLAAPLAAPPPLDELAVVSWNLHVGGADLEALVERLRAGAFTGGRPVRRFALLVQEAHRAGDAVPAAPAAGVRVPKPIGIGGSDPRRADIVSVAARLGLALYYVPSMRNGGGDSDEDRGNAILSTEPLSDLEAIELPFERQRRVAVAATVQVAGSDGRPWPLRLASVHLEATAAARHLWLFGDARQRQARSLVDALPDDAPVVVGGDFNTWFGFADATYAAMRAAVADAAAGDRRATFGPLRLDHVFSRAPAGWEVTARRLDHRFGSDHYPLLALVHPAPRPVPAG